MTRSSWFLLSALVILSLNLLGAPGSSASDAAARPAGIQAAGASDVVIANLDASQSAMVVGDFYGQRGGPPISIALPPVPAQGTADLDLAEVTQLANGSFAAIFSSDRSIGTLTTTRWAASGGAATYEGAAASTDVIVPLAVKGAEGHTSLVTIQNTDPSAQANVQVQLVRTGETMPTKTINLSISPGTSVTVDLGKDPSFVDVPSGFVGAMRVTSATPIAVQTFVDVETSAKAVYGFDGVPAEAAASRLLAPVTHADWVGPDGQVRASRIALANPGAVHVDASLRFLGRGGICAGMTFIQGPVTIGGGSSVVLDQSTGSGPMPRGCEASAVVDVIGGGVVGTVVDLTAASGMAAAYNLSAEGDAALRTVVARFRRGVEGTTAIYAQNADPGSPATATIAFFRQDGMPLTGCGAPCTAAIPPGAAARWFAADLDAIPPGTIGHAVITSDVPLVVVAIDEPEAGPWDLTASAGLPADSEGGAAGLHQATATPGFSIPVPGYVPILLKRGGPRPPTVTPRPTEFATETPELPVTPPGPSIPTRTPWPEAWPLDGVGDSAVFVQNLDPSQSASIVLDLYSARGGPPTSMVLPPVPPDSIGIVDLQDRAEVANGVYAVTASSDRQIGTLAEHFWHLTGAMVFHDAPSRSTDVVVPWVARLGDGRTSIVTVQNTDPNMEATASLTFTAAGGAVPTKVVNVRIAPGTALTIDLASSPDLADLPVGFVGWLRARSATPLAVQSIVAVLGSEMAAYAVPGVPAEMAADTLFVPRLLRRHASYPGSPLAASSTLHVLNPGADAIAVTAQYHGAAGACAGQAWSEGPVSLAPGDLIPFPQSGRPPSGMPDDCAASAVVKVTGGKALGVVAEVGEGDAFAGAYAAFGATERALRVGLPLYRRQEESGQSTGIHVMNAGDVAAHMQVTFRDSSGQLVTGCGAACAATIPPSEARTWWPPDIAALADATIGTAIVESDQPIVVVVDDRMMGDSVDIAMYRGLKADTGGQVPARSWQPLLLNDAQLSDPPVVPGPATPTPPPTPTPAAGGPLLSLPPAIPAGARGAIRVPIVLDTAGEELGIVTFQLDIYSAWVTFDPTDGDEDGLPDAVIFNVPAGYDSRIVYDPGIVDGELQFEVSARPGTTVPLSDGTLVEVVLAVGPRRMADDPPAVRFGGATSFADLSGSAVEGEASGETAVPIAAPRAIHVPFCESDRVEAGR